MYNGVINVYKEKGYTSHDVVAIIRRLTRSKCGHTGTLDPDATGVLPICLGRATKMADKISAQDKSYTAEIIFGAETDTQDATGKVTAEALMNFTESEYHEVLKSFVGEYWQTPPMYSAIKINGKKLYELARKGKEIERPPRLVNIYEIVPINGNKIGVTCSKGTYIRTLCADIGKKLGGYAHMGSLERTRSGVFLVKDSIRLDAIRLCLANGTFADILQNVET